MDNLRVEESFRNWKITGEPKCGTSAVVYQVEKDGVTGAMKIFTGRANSDDHRRFLREVEILGEIEHPSVPTVKENGTRDTPPYVVMTFFPGKTLKEWHTDQGRDIPLGVTLSVVASIATALGEILSNAKYVHRDIKLENVIYDEVSRRLGIIDFGLAKKIDELAKLPTSWEPLAAPRYRSPEKIVDFHAANLKGDVWSLGVILYFLLVNRFPFEVSHAAGSEFMLMEKIKNEPHRPPSEFRPDCKGKIDELVALLLSKSDSIRPDFDEASYLISAINYSKVADISVFGQYAKNRSRRYSLSTFGWEDWAQVGVIGQIDRLLSANYRNSIAAYIDPILAKTMRLLFDYPVRWGPFRDSPSPKAANVAEVLYAFANATATSPETYGIFRAATEWLWSVTSPDGIPSLSLNKAPTTYCTAITSLALRSSALTWARVDAEHTSHLNSFANIAAQQCLGLVHPSGGWGTFKGTGPVRINTSMWALRCLARSVAAGDLKFLEQFRQVQAMHSDGKPGQFGFQPQAEPQLGTTALWLLLLHDVRDAQHLSVEEAMHLTSHPTEFINSVLESERIVRRVEHEVYYVDRVDYKYTGGVEQLNWNHPSEALAIEAMALSDIFSIYDQQQFRWFARAMKMLHELEMKGALAATPSQGQSGCVYLTCFAVRALHSVIRWLQHPRCGNLVCA